MLNNSQIKKIKLLRRKGWSYTEIKKYLKIGHGTAYRHGKYVEIGKRYQSSWKEKQASSVKRQKVANEAATTKAKRDIDLITRKEKLILLVALYWGEGNKKDFGINNSDPEMISIFVNGIRDIFKINNEQLRISIRIFQNMDEMKCKNYWSRITGVSDKNFLKTEIIHGKKIGKLEHGMCRIRVRKGGNMLKYMLASKNQIVSILSSRSSMDRTTVS